MERRAGYKAWLTNLLLGKTRGWKYNLSYLYAGYTHLTYDDRPWRHDISPWPRLGKNSRVANTSGQHVVNRFNKLWIRWFVDRGVIYGATVVFADIDRQTTIIDAWTWVSIIKYIFRDVLDQWHGKWSNVTIGDVLRLTSDIGIFPCFNQ